MKPSEKILSIALDLAKKNWREEHKFDSWELEEDGGKMELESDKLQYIVVAILEYLDQITN